MTNYVNFYGKELARSAAGEFYQVRLLFRISARTLLPLCLVLCRELSSKHFTIEWQREVEIPVQEDIWRIAPVIQKKIWSVVSGEGYFGTFRLIVGNRVLARRRTDPATAGCHQMMSWSFSGAEQLKFVFCRKNGSGRPGGRRLITQDPVFADAINRRIRLL